ncbi:hypothetical protein C1645_815270 [Glomus cerebriforme]|uniref:Uncharacterized protein n=1 Tax=Glomus cerebriforme TaxID=658196 RepID=A0A397TEA6_9GLOM|nr:hypothetical protein C1645_815270 [Glomus cerebriforme]
MLKARKLYILFNTLELEKIKQIFYSTDAILSLNYQQIQNIIDYMNLVINSHNETIKILYNQNHIISKINLTNIYIPPKALQSKPTYDQSYFYSKILDQYPNLYREFSNENFDYYGITNKTSCLLYKLNYSDEENIEGKYKAESYFIKYK